MQAHDGRHNLLQRKHLAVLLAVVVWLVWGMLSEYQSADHSVMKTTIVRTLLATELCQSCGVWYQDDWEVCCNYP